MAVSKAQQRAVNKYVKSNYDEVKLRMPKGKKMSFRRMRRSRGNPSMPTSTVPLMKPCSGMILQLKCINVRSRRRISLRRFLTSIIYLKYRTFFAASQCIASALIGGKGSPQEIGASAIFTSTGSPPKGRTAFWVEMLTDVFGPPSKCRCNFARTRLSPRES